MTETEVTAGAAPPEEQPTQYSAEDVEKILQAAITEFGTACAAQFPAGSTVNPISIIVQQQLEIEKLSAVVDELIDAHVLDDVKVTMRYVDRLTTRIVALRKPRIALAVGAALNGVRHK